jgi:hypothetical protein
MSFGGWISWQRQEVAKFQLPTKQGGRKDKRYMWKINLVYIESNNV